MADGQAEIVSRDPETVSGEPVFAGTRVPAQNLVDYLKAGHALDNFLDGFPSVGRKRATAYLDMTLEAADLTRSAGWDAGRPSRTIPSR